MVNKQYYVYILANNTNVSICTGVTNNIKRRVYEHKERLTNGFPERYGINKLVYYEIFEDPENAILRENQIKGARKNRLIESMNPAWTDLYDGI